MKWELTDSKTACRKNYFFSCDTRESHLVLIITACSCLALPYITVSNVNQDSRCGRGLGIAETKRGMREVESE